jgi:hypothetical protein
MSVIKFPNMQKGTTKLGVDTIFFSDYIYVSNYHAFVTDLQSIVGVNLKMLFEIQRNNDEEEEMDYYLHKRLDVLEYLDGRFVTPKFWEELVKATDMEVIDHVQGKSYIEINSRGIKKDLFYVAPFWNHDNQERDAMEHYENYLKEYVAKEELAVKTSTLPWNMIKIIQAIFGTTVKNDVLLVEHFGNDKMQRFTFGKNKMIFGLLASDYDASQELFKSLQMEAYVKGDISRTRPSYTVEAIDEVSDVEGDPNLFKPSSDLKYK